ncbi:MAG: hypothetical protein ACEPO8_15100 [Rhodothermaceae bacterium]
MPHENRHTYFKLAAENQRKCGLAQLRKNKIFRKDMIYNKPETEPKLSVMKQFDLINHDISTTRDKIN